MNRRLDPATIWRDFQITLEQCGHSDVALTLRLYSHVRLAMHRQAAERLEELYAMASIVEE